MIQNIKQLESMPVARTNIIKLKETTEQLIERLLCPVSNLFAIDFRLRTFPKARNERKRDYYLRAHREVKQLIRKALGIAALEEVRYELIHLGNGKFAFFYINQAAKPNSQEQQSVAERVNTLCAQLAAEPHNLNQLVEGLFGLHLKIALLEQAADRFSIEPAYINAELYLNPLISQQLSKASNGVMEAFRLEIFFSEQHELIFTLIKSKFQITPADELSVSLDEESVWFNTSSGRLNAKRALDARDSKLEFFRDRSGYGASQAYTYNVVMDMVCDRLATLAIPFNEVTFEATHEVDNYICELDTALSNRLLIVNAGVPFSDEQQTLFFSYLAEHFSHYTLLSEADFITAQASHFKGWHGHTSVLVLNPVPQGSKNSIRNLSDKSEEQQYNDFFQAYTAHRNSPHHQWDFYTDLKINRLTNWLDEKPFQVVLQGLNVDDKMLSAIDYITELKQTNPSKLAEDLDTPKGKLRTSLNTIKGKMKRTKTELWFKEALLSLKSITSIQVNKGHYSTYFTRAMNKGKNKTYLLGYVEILADDNGLTIVAAGVAEGDLDLLANEHSPLSRLSKLYSNGAYLYDHHRDTLLTSYNSVRVPRIIGPTAFSVVDAYRYQEDEKAQAESEHRSDTFSDYTITRTTKPLLNILPYYLAPGRTKSDALAASPKLKHHHTYLQPHEDGMYVLMTAAQPANNPISKQILIENILVWDADGRALDVFLEPLTSVYLNSFTLDMLRNSESSKTSVFTKLAKLMVEN